MTRRSSKRQVPRGSKRPGKPGGVRDTNRKARKAALIDAALLLYLDHGVSNVAVDDITTKAGVAKGSFYRYFEDQEALVEELIAPARRTLTSALITARDMLEGAVTAEKQIEAYRGIGEALGVLLLESPGPARLYLQECRAPAVGTRKPIGALAKRVIDLAEEVSTVAQKHGLLKPLPVPVTARAVVGAAERLFLGVLLDEEMGNVLEIPLALVTLVVDGLRARTA